MKARSLLHPKATQPSLKKAEKKVVEGLGLSALVFRAYGFKGYARGLRDVKDHTKDTDHGGKLPPT